MNQAVELGGQLAGDGEKIDTVLNLKINDEVIFSRMTGRRSCPECGAVYHVENLKPRVEGKCDRDGTELIQRTDDAPDVVKNRLETYYRQTRPVVDYYRKNGTVYDIDANNDVEQVSSLIFEILDVLASVPG